MEYNFPMLLDNPRAWRTYLGGRLLDELHGNRAGEDGHFPEEWILSVVAARNAGREHLTEEGLSRLAESGEILKQVIEANPAALLGSAHAAQNGPQLGVLVKLIDSAERLAVQVHPNRQKAMELFSSPYGKTECWHILGGREVDGQKPYVYLGFREGITREIWQALFERQDIGRMLTCLHRFEVEPGDTILIEGGVPHAIGAGCFLAEIQEPTDYTIRVERTTPSGYAVADSMCHQGLGFEKMFDCFDYTPMTAEQVRDRWFIPAATLQQEAGGSVRTLIGYGDTPFFRMDEIRVSGSLTVDCGDRFSGLYVLEGQGEMAANGQSAKIGKARQYFVPAGVGNITFTAAGGQPLRILHCFGAQPQ